MNWISLALVLLSSLLCHAQSRVGSLLINAEKSFRDTDQEIIELEGKVQVVYRDQHLSAQKARIDLRARILEAEGQVLLVNPEYSLGGERVRLEYETNTGFIVGGFVQSRNVLIEGDFIEKRGPKEFVIQNARYTTCENCPETWSFSGARLRAELGGYAFIKSSILKLGSVPVFWFPYLAVPLQSERQSGLLTPSYDFTSDSGFIFSQPIFWAISRSQDATLTLRNYERRGFKLLANHRYLLNEKSYGDLDASVLDDRLFASSDRVRVFRSGFDRSTPINRWFLKYRHFYELPEGFVNRVQLKNASDLQYPLDFPRETGTASEGWLENRISVTRSQSDQFWSVDASYYTNLLQSDPLSTNNDSVHQLPEIRWSQLEKRLGSSHFFFASDFRFNNFARSSFSYDEMNSNLPTLGSSSNSTGQRRLKTLGSPAICQTDSWETDPSCFAFRTGVYDPLKDQLRTGQRADLGLSLSHPWRFSRLDLLPRLTYRETHYLFNAGAERFSARRLARAEISTRTSFSALYEGSSNQDDVSRFKHEIQPEITYSTIPWIDHPAHAFWGNNSSATIPPSLQENISDADLNSPYALQFDYYDRIQDRKLLTYGITNKIVRKKTRPSGESTYSQLLSWRIAQAYDLFQVESSDPLAQAYSDVSSELVLSFDWFEVYQKANYYPSQKVTNTSTRFRFFNEQGESVSLSYNSTFDTARGQAASQLRQEILFSGKKNFSQFDLILAGSYDQTPGAANPWKSYAYAVQYRLPGNCWYVIWSQFLETTGNFGWNVKFDFSWDGKPNPRLTEDALQARSTSWYTPSAF